MIPFFVHMGLAQGWYILYKKPKIVFADYFHMQLFEVYSNWHPYSLTDF